MHVHGVLLQVLIKTAVRLSSGVWYYVLGRRGVWG
jgi:hypothetical protein